ncbi:conserved hypothetical protein [Candidatus Methylobacter favarea]|uniref:Uncharacterized protein n=1 Tax=Candidatus Methylobacter favarea TaxID=2707345 RepID=A0A8S0WAF8_9GAMM|nr:hypothetical protein [Candidatus Methylobacter favarea]CAA9890709.1 conserved hypothetical protein [Candidatus Methylobacter favarea]
MSDQENTKKTIDSAKNMAGNLTSSILSLKEKQPKVFFGAIGGIVLLILIMMMSGGDKPTPVSGPTVKDLVAGQKYILKSPNTYDPKATVRLVPVPGTMAAYDDTEEADRTSPCQHLPQGTPVSVIDFQDAFGKKNAFVKVQIEEGECKGNAGWTLAINIQ